MKHKHLFHQLGFILATIFVFASCATKKEVAQTITVDKNNAQAYVNRVRSNAVTAQNIVSKIECSIGGMGSDMSVDGKLQMRRNQIVRITLYAPILGFEVGKLEFTPEYVMLVNKMHKQYVRSSYTDVPFLKSNKLDFYAIQALFWGELFVPGVTNIDEKAAQSFFIDSQNRIALNHNNLKFAWLTDASKALITGFEAGLSSTESASQAVAKSQYSDFVVVENKQFPKKIAVSFSLDSAGKGPFKLELKLGKITTDGSWDATSTVPAKYQSINVDDLFKSLLNN